MPRPTKGEIREVLTAMKSSIRELENRITEDNGDLAAVTLETLDEQMGMAIELIEFRYPDSFEDEVEVEGVEVEEPN